MKVVLDAWAILAYLQREEPAAARITEVLRQAEKKEISLFVSLINIGEVFYMVGRRKGEEAAEETLQELHHLPLAMVVPDRGTIIKAAGLKIHYPLSYADAFAAVTAQDLNATLLTGDRELLQLRDVLSIEALKRHR